MPESFCLETVKETTTAAQGEVDDNDDKTIRFSAKPNMHGSIFDGFTDFELDLSCLSPPSSPTPSTSNLPPDSPSPPSSPILTRSTSFITQMSPLPQKKSKKRLSSPHLGATASATTSRGSWPLIKYAGRGTPIDRNRRLQWGGFSGEEVVAEDGLLFSTVRSTSLDSAIRPSQRSASPEWSHISRLSSSHSHTASSESASRGDGSVHEQPPELAPILIEGLGADKSDEWASIMKTVLASSSSTETPRLAKDVPSPVPQVDSEIQVHPKRKSVATIESRFMSPEQIEQLNNGLEIDLGLNAALDLGLGRRGGMNWFDLGLLPRSTNGHETPSVYSSRAPTPRASPPPSVHASEHRSTTSTKAEGNNGDIAMKSESHAWWRRFLLHLRKVQSLITVHKNRF
ncbi:hypothetical protein BYT27DRAFT_7176576 [Phlegmacium glaucopus]|nr:hypothetical protein BYT27DRAFT_7176576 [Phlegmacium glaucopus]